MEIQLKVEDDGGPLTLDGVTSQDSVDDQMKRDGIPNSPDLDHEKPPVEDDGGSLTVDDVTSQGHVLLQNLIADQMKRDGIPNPPALDHKMPPGEGTERRGEGGLTAEDEKRIGRAIRILADKYNQEITRKIGNTPQCGRMEVFQRNVQDVFRDGQFSWTKVVQLFDLASKFCVDALAVDGGLINQFIKFTIDTIHDRVAAWIIGRGGWVAILKELITWKWQVVAVSGAVVVVAAAFYCGYRLGSSNA